MEIIGTELLEKSGAAGNRTLDLMHAKHALYQLSHNPIYFLKNFCENIIIISFNLFFHSPKFFVFAFTHKQIKKNETWKELTKIF